jgi:hypothetical protein
MIRRAAASFLVLLFAIVSLSMFFVMALSNTFLRASFYEGKVRDGIYDFLMDVTVKKITDSDELIKSSFSESELRTEITNVYTKELFYRSMSDLGDQIEKLKADPHQPMTINLKLFRESLLTVAHNLAYEYFKTIPVCKGGEVPEMDVKGLPTCVPEKAEYNEIATSLTGQFEKAVYGAIPEQIQYDLSAGSVGESSVLTQVFEISASVRYILYGVLLFLIIMIALLIYAPFSDILKYEGMAFATSGILGYFLGFGLESLPKMIIEKMEFDGMKERIQKFVEFLFSFLVADLQKVALIFLAFGGVLILLQVFLKRNARVE